MSHAPWFGGLGLERQCQLYLGKCVCLRKIRDMDEGVVKGSEDTGNSKHEFT